MEENNVAGDIETIISNIPDNLTDVEKVRWLYINLGKIFSYDLRVMEDCDIKEQNIDYKRGETTFINRYQTCKQISQIFSSILNSLGIKSSIIEREIWGKNYADNHLAVEVDLFDAKYLLDLTLDLFLIQSGCKTKEFGFSTNRDNDYDILSLNEVKAMDKKLGFLNNDNYLDDEILRLKSLNSLQEKIKIINNLEILFKGSHEALLFFKKIYSEILTPEELKNFHVYNLYFIKEDDINFNSIFIFNNDMIYLYDKNIGFIETDEIKIKSMLENGFKTNSRTLEDRLDELEEYRASSR